MERRPLILHVIHHLKTGGLENGLVNLINHLPESRFRHAVACVEDYSDFRNRIKRPDVEVVALERSRVGVWGVRRALYRLCRDWKPAVVHSRNQSGLDALLPARLAGVPFCIHSEHGWDTDDIDGKKFKPALLRRLHTPLVSQYLTVSRHLQDYLVRRVGIDARRIRQIYNGVDTARFAPRAHQPRVALPPGFAPEGAVVIGTVGRLQAVKDQATLLKAFAEACKHAPRMRLVIVGDGPLRDELQALANSLGISDTVWFSGALSDVPAVLRELDVFVLPSLSEGISNTILEALSCGVPVVATAVGGNPELIQDGQYGRLFTPGDVPALSQILLDYAASPELRLQHAGAARRVAVEQFSLDKMMANYQAVYERQGFPAAQDMTTCLRQQS
jgi:sugar transferase (PEP-CTERM/EpsH1 system associated)